MVYPNKFEQLWKKKAERTPNNNKKAEKMRVEKISVDTFQALDLLFGMKKIIPMFEMTNKHFGEEER